MDHLNDILAALSKGLDTLFPDIPVYAEEIPHRLPKRCFLIGFAGKVEIKKEIGERYRVSGSLDITYLAPQEGPETDTRREMNGVAARITLELGVIRHKQMALRLRTHNCRTDGNELHDVCGFSAFLYRLDRTPVMDRVKVGEKLVKPEGGK